MSFYLTRSNIALHYRFDTRVADEPPLVLINSLGSDLRIWDEICEHLHDHFSILRYDKRGHGLSDSPAPPYTMQDHVDDLLDLLIHLDIQELHLVGISVGGIIAMQLAARHPGRIRRLVLCDTAPRIGSREMWDQRIENLEAEGLEKMGETILERWFAPGFAHRNPAEYRGYLNMLMRTPLDGYIGTCAALREADLSGVLSNIDVPALVLCGEHDLATPPAQAARFASSMPDATLHVIVGAGHLPCIEQPEPMAAQILQFLTGGKG